MSLQEYLLAELVRTAALRTPADLVEEVTERLRTEGPAGFSRVTAAEIVHADRTSH